MVIFLTSSSPMLQKTFVLLLYSSFKMCQRPQWYPLCGCSLIFPIYFISWNLARGSPGPRAAPYCRCFQSFSDPQKRFPWKGWDHLSGFPVLTAQQNSSEPVGRCGRGPLVISPLLVLGSCPASGRGEAGLSGVAVPKQKTRLG